MNARTIDRRFVIRFRIFAMLLLAALAQCIPAQPAEARILNSNLGRWMTRDPLGFVDGANTYSFVDTSPIVGLDQSGLQCVRSAEGDEAITPEHEYCEDWCLRPDLESPTALAKCRDGRPICCACISWRIPFEEKHFKIWDVLLRCIDTCEPLHFPNLDCQDGEGGSWAGVGQECSEWKVNRCTRRCLDGFDCQTENTKAGKRRCESIERNSRHFEIYWLQRCMNVQP